MHHTVCFFRRPPGLVLNVNLFLWTTKPNCGTSSLPKSQHLVSPIICIAYGFFGAGTSAHYITFDFKISTEPKTQTENRSHAKMYASPNGLGVRKANAPLPCEAGWPWRWQLICLDKAFRKCSFQYRPSTLPPIFGSQKLMNMKSW